MHATTRIGTNASQLIGHRAQIVDEAWSKSDPAIAPTYRMSVPVFLHFRWGLFFGAHLLLVASNQLGKGEEPSLSMLRGSAALAGAGSMVRSAAAALAICLIDRLSDRQARRWANILAARAVTQHAPSGRQGICRMTTRLGG